MNCAPFNPNSPSVTVDRVKWYVYSTRIAASDVMDNERKEITEEGDFYLTSILGQDPGNMLVRFQWPTGRYSSQSLMLSSLVYGSQVNGRSFLFRESLRAEQPGREPFICIPQGDEIGIELQNLDAINAANVVIVFEGFHRTYAK
jgi:hypothetical protein